MILPHTVHGKKSPLIVTVHTPWNEIKRMEFNCSRDQYEKGFKKYQEGNALMQEAFPFLTPDEREFLMTGTTREEWEEMFPED